MKQFAMTVMFLLASTSMGSAATPRFDGRGWTVGNAQRNAAQSLTEYVLPGQTVKRWTELVTSTVYLQPVPLAALVERVHASLADGCPSLVWNVLRQDEKTAVVEWRDAGCGGFEAQSEIDRFAIQKDGLYRLAYAAKGKRPLLPERREQWLQILTQVPLAEGSIGGSAGADTASAAADAAAGRRATEALAAGVRLAGWSCPAGVKSDIKGRIEGPQGPLSQWTLECSNGQQYTVLVDPSGAMTTFQAPR